MNTQDFKINGHYYINLDQYLDVDGIRSCYDEIAKGIVLSESEKVPVEVGKQESLFDPTHIAPNLWIKNNFIGTEEYNNLVKEGLSKQQIYNYVMYKYPVKSLGYKILLRSYEGYHDNFHKKNLENLNVDCPCYKHFPRLKQWIYDSKIFDQVGRIIIFSNQKGEFTPTHCDYQSLKSHKDQFIWINLFERKKFFVFDANFNKEYIKGDINIFDNASWHGGEPAEYCCFSIRIDGIFTEKFLKETNLYEHFNKNI